MKYKTRKALVIIALAIGTLMTSAFTFENNIPIEVKPALNQIVPYWENADDVKLNLSFSSGVANCTLNVLGKQNVSKITAYGSSLNATRLSGITPGYTYRLEADIKVYNGSNVEDISLYKEGYYW